jgi:hypothetical protein
VARRARNKKWRDVQEVPGVTVSVGTASARAFLPCPVHRTAAVVQDAGYTEVAPGSVTVVAVTR